MWGEADCQSLSDVVKFRFATTLKLQSNYNVATAINGAENTNKKLWFDVRGGGGEVGDENT